MANKESLMTKIKKTTPLALALMFALCPGADVRALPYRQHGANPVTAVLRRSDAGCLPDAF